MCSQVKNTGGDPLETLALGKKIGVDAYAPDVAERHPSFAA